MADRTQVAEQALILIAHGVDPVEHIDPDEGRHTPECWGSMLRNGDEHYCFCNGGVAYAKPLAALLDATADTPAVAA